MTDAAAIIERLRAATGADYALDEMIFAAVRGWSYPLVGAAYRDCANAGRPDYTASLDAALTLVPEGYDWIIGNVNGALGGTPYAQVGRDIKEFGETPAIALCIAALLARQAAEAGDG